MHDDDRYPRYSGDTTKAYERYGERRRPERLLHFRAGVGSAARGTHCAANATSGLCQAIRAPMPPGDIRTLGAVRSSKASPRRCATAASIRASSALGDAAVSTACRGSGVGGDHEAGNSGIERLQTSARCPNGCIRPAWRQSRAGSYRKVLIDLQGSHLRGTLLFCRKSNVTERRGESRLAATGRRLTARSAAAEGACQDRSIDPSHRWYAHATLDGQN